MSQSTTRNFNTNRWYQILPSNDSLALSGTATWEGEGYGSVITHDQNRTDYEQQWQIYSFSSTLVVLRTRASGPDNYLRVQGADWYGDGPIPKPRMSNASTPDLSMFWSMGKWADGSFYLWNAENGTNYHLNTTLTSWGHTEMISLNPQPKEGQSFSFKELGEINNQTFSTINTPPSIALATPATSTDEASSRSATRTHTSSSSSSTKSSSKDSSGASNGQVMSSSGTGGGLSTGAKAAIGVCAAVAVVVLFALGLFWVRRCRRRRQNKAVLEVLKVYPQDLVHEAPALQHRPAPAELYAVSKAPEMDGGAKFEMDGAVKYEIDGGEKYEMGDGGRERPRSLDVIGMGHYAPSLHNPMHTMAMDFRRILGIYPNVHRRIGLIPQEYKILPSFDDPTATQHHVLD
ncbi:uncharacterized protein IWZ02DRAFT_492555 [Phyllosticta citriasiana]|uniref:uncharacterized protein n=1 Tax=Phyllosticta citriasiana TaxID=595635 RepID=UPI0030FD21DB